MTARKLRKLYLKQNPHGTFFEKKTLAANGDTLNNFRTSQTPVFVRINDGYGEARRIKAWELKRQKPNKKGYTGSSFFSCGGFVPLHGVEREQEEVQQPVTLKADKKDVSMVTVRFTVTGSKQARKEVKKTILDALTRRLQERCDAFTLSRSGTVAIEWEIFTATNPLSK